MYMFDTKYCLSFQELYVFLCLETQPNKTSHSLIDFLVCNLFYQFIHSTNIFYHY